MKLLPACESGGIGRRTRLRIWRGNPWGFESPLSHQMLAVCGPAPYPASMEIGRAIVEKLSVYISAVIPGAAAIYVYYLANPSFFQPFLRPNAFGYATKVGIILIGAFAVGTSVTTFSNAFWGALGGAFGAIRVQMGPKWPQVPNSAPWRDPKWRKLALAYFGEHSPANTLPMTDLDFDLRVKATNTWLPEAERAAAVEELRRTRMRLASDDADWRQWYSQIEDLRKAEEKQDFEDVFSQTLRSSLQSTAIYLLISMVFVPSLRNWICGLICAGWLIVVTAEVFTALRGSSDPWNTWSIQLGFLTKKVITRNQ
jgi:hypothetical protein